MTKITRKNKTAITLGVIAVVLGVSYGVQQYKSMQQIKKLHSLITEQFRLESRTKIMNCEVDGDLPDPACTPGAVFPSVTKEQICKSGYSSTVRDVTQSLKNQVYTEYNIKTHTTGQYEVDHFISLELGGSNDIANLWPEAANPVPGFHEKDQVENYLHNTLCSGKINLQEAQYLIGKKWLEVYKLIQ